MNVWRSIPGFAGYEVSDTGKLRRTVRMHNYLPGPISGSVNAKGYLRHCIQSDDGRTKSICAHQLVMLAFVGPVPDGMCVCHDNGNPIDNRLSNLRYDTPLANSHDRFRHGTVPFGEECVVSVITESIAIEIYNRCLSGERQADIANDFGITQACVCDVFRRKTWRHLGLPRVKHVRRFSDSDVGTMHRMRSAGMTKSAISREFKTSPQAVSYCLNLRKQELAA